MFGMNIWQAWPRKIHKRNWISVFFWECQVVVLLALSWREPSMGHQWCLGIVEPMLLLLSGLWTPKQRSFCYPDTPVFCKWRRRLSNFLEVEASDTYILCIDTYIFGKYIVIQCSDITQKRGKHMYLFTCCTYYNSYMFGNFSVYVRFTKAPSPGYLPSATTATTTTITAVAVSPSRCRFGFDRNEAVKMPNSDKKEQLLGGKTPRKRN